MSANCIFKYRLELTGRQTIQMPRNATALSAQLQGADICIWAFVDRDAEVEGRLIFIYGTGQPMPETDGLARYVGTVQRGAFVWHVFEGVQAPF